MPWRRKTFDELPALSIRGRQLRSALRTVTAGLMFFMLFFACTSGSHVKIYLRMLGFNNFTFGLLSAIPFAATFLQIFAAILIERTGLKKYQFIHLATLYRMSWLLVAILPFLLPQIPSTVAVVLMLCIMGCSQVLAALAVPAYMTWMGDLIPRRIRGRYLGNRHRLAQAVRIPAVIGVGILMDATFKADVPETAAAQPVVMRIICIILAVGAVFGIIDILLFRRIREVLPTTPDRPRRPSIDINVRRPRRYGPLALAGYLLRYIAQAVRQILLPPLKDQAFRRFVLHGVTVTFAAIVSGWYFWLNAMENLGFGNLATNMLFLVFAPISGLIAAKGWGRLIDRWGRRPVLVLSTVIIVFAITPWFFVTRHTPAPSFVAGTANWLAHRLGTMLGWQNLVLIPAGAPVGAYLGGMLGCILGGAGWMGIEMARMSIYLGFADSHGRSKHVAAAAALTSIGGVLGGVVGGTLTQALEFLQKNPILVGPFSWNNWHVAFAISIMARVAAVFCVIGMSDPGAGRVRDMVRLIRSNVYNNVRTRLFYRLRTFRWGRGRNNNANGRQDETQDRNP